MLQNMSSCNSELEDIYETRGVDEENLIHNVPMELRRYIKRHLCLALLTRLGGRRVRCSRLAVRSIKAGRDARVPTSIVSTDGFDGITGCITSVVGDVVSATSQL
ncbi:hypothetical protein Leryth_027281 [Lithospermum erythrorhizon]|nr:hypothetical protein Leryth_027281 [Lithospermum erythrorhizon]